MATEHQADEWSEDPWTGPSEWYPYHCCVCECKMWVEDIVVDAFPPHGPGKCPILFCPECGEDFVRDISEHPIMSKSDPNVSR